VTQSVRALEAALVQVVAYASLRGEAPTPELAARLLGRLNPQRRPQSCNIDAIVKATAIRFDVPANALLARDRRPVVARARKVAMRVVRELTGHSLPEIGRAFGGRDHTTVLSALRSIDREIAADPALAAVVDSLRETFLDPS
jgi:chromosomal replication initiator protein